MVGAGLIFPGQSGIKEGCMEEVTFKQHFIRLRKSFEVDRERNFRLREQRKITFFVLISSP